MNIITIELRKITASEGMVLTNGNEYSKEIFLGKNDSPDNWNEITDAEYSQVLKEKELSEAISDA